MESETSEATYNLKEKKRWLNAMKMERKILNETEFRSLNFETEFREKKDKNNFKADECTKLKKTQMKASISLRLVVQSNKKF